MVNWKLISTAPTERQFWAIDDERTIYRVRWYADAERQAFIDQMYDEATDLTHWCELAEIPLP